MAKHIYNEGSEDIPEITVEQINNALKEIKAVGPDGILAGMMVETWNDLKRKQSKLFNNKQYLHYGI